MHVKETPKETQTSKAGIIYRETPSSFWLYSVIFIAGLIAGVLLLLGYKFVRDQRAEPLSNDALLAKLYPYISKDKRIEIFVRELYAKKSR